MILGLKTDKKIWICDMAFPQQKNIGSKRTEKLTGYRELAFETRAHRPGYKILTVPVIVGAFGCGIKALNADLKKIFDNNELLDKVESSEELYLFLFKEKIMSLL